MVIRPYAYAIWENIQHILDGMFRLQVTKMYVCLCLSRKAFCKRKKDHVEGFAPEVAWVTMGGNEKLEDRLCVRPTSETLFCEHYANIVHSYRDLPKLYNQWVSVVRWEKTTRPFPAFKRVPLAGGSYHSRNCSREAIEELRECLISMPISAKKPSGYGLLSKVRKQKAINLQVLFLPAIEALMHDGKALQAGNCITSATASQSFSGIEFTDKGKQTFNPHQTSWGVTTSNRCCNYDSRR